MVKRISSDGQTEKKKSTNRSFKISISSFAQLIYNLLFIDFMDWLHFQQYSDFNWNQIVWIRHIFKVIFGISMI